MLGIHLQFHERYYCWSLQDWKREISEKFSLLRSISDNNARLAIRLMRTVGEDQQWLLAKALTKRFRKVILAHWGDKFTKEDKRFEDLFMQELSRASLIEPTYPNIDKPQAPKLDQKHLKSCLHRTLAPIIGEPYEDLGGGLLRYRTLIEPWQIVTYFDIGGRFHQLSYGHDIMGSEYVYLARSISLLEWLGISSQVMLQGIYNSDVEPTAKALSKIIKHFMDAAPKLLEGLSPDLKE